MEVKIYKPIIVGLLAGTGFCFFWGFFLGVDRTSMALLVQDLMISVAISGYGSLYARSKLGIRFKYLIWLMVFVAAALTALYTYSVFYTVVFYEYRRPV